MGVKIAFLGDVMCGDSFYALGRGVASSLEKYNDNFLSPVIAEFLGQHNLVFCNLECVLSDVGRKDWNLRSLQMRGRPEFARLLAKWGINLVNVANNHILEHGRAAACDTVSTLKESNIQPVGAGKNLNFHPGIQVHKIKVGNEQLAIIGLSLLKEKYVYDGGGDFDDVLKITDDLSKQGWSVLVSLHWGQELMHSPNAEQKSVAAQLVHAGAKLIIGHHPHTVQGIEKLNGSLIAYSLGNFIFDSILPDCRWSIILSVSLDSRGISGWDIFPVELDSEQ